MPLSWKKVNGELIETLLPFNSVPNILQIGLISRKFIVTLSNGTSIKHLIFMSVIHRKYIALLFCALAICTLCSCIYDYTPADASLQGLDEPLLVVDGDIIVGDFTKVKLSYTESILEDVEEMPLGCTVMVEAESGETVGAFAVEDEPGVYLADTRELDLDGKYRLSISVPGRGEFVSEFKPVMISPPIDEITWSIAPDSTYANVEVTTHNDQEGKLYCKWNYTENWESNAVFIPVLDFNPNTNILRALEIEEIAERSYCFSEAVSSDIRIANTEKLAENIISKTVVKHIANTDLRASGLYAISVTQKALDKDGYQYWETLKRNIGETGGIFSAQPTELVGNIRSVTNENEKVVGYISVSTSAKMMAFIDWGSTGFFKTECVYFTMKIDPKYFIKELKTHFYNGYRPVFMPETGELLYISTLQCTDCRSYSNSTKPDFWPEK